MNIHIQIFVGAYVFTSSVYISKNGFLVHIANLCLTFWETDKTFSKVPVPLYTPISIYKGSSLSTSEPIFISVILIMVALMGVKYLIEVLICIALIANNVNFFSCA